MLFGGSIRKLGGKLAKGLREKAQEYHDKAIIESMASMRLHYTAIGVSLETTAEVIEKAVANDEEDEE